MNLLSTALGLGAAIATAVVPATAVGAARATPTEVHIKQGFTFDEATGMVVISGRVSSPRAACAEDRKVILRQTDSDARVGTDRTNDRNRWQVSFSGDDVGPGTFVAVAPRVRVNGAPCARDKDAQEIGPGQARAWR